MSAVEISYILPCYNAGAFLPAAIESIKVQRGDFEITEIIVVDDRSDDEETLDVLADLRRAADVQVVPNPRRQGPGAARNHGVSLAQAEWVAFLDSDDLLTADSVQCRVAAMREFPGSRYFGADFCIWWPDGRRDEPFFRSRAAPARHLATGFARDSSILLRRPVEPFLDAAMCHNGTMLVAKALMQAVGGYEESLLYCEDHHLFVKLANETDYVFSRHIAMLYRQHPKSMTALPFPPSGHYSKALELLDRDATFREYRSTIRKILSRCRAQTAEWYRSQNRFDDALREALRSVIADPLSAGAWKQIAAAVLKVA